MVNGQLTDVLLAIVYSGVVSLHSIRPLILLAELNDTDIWDTDIGKAYIEAFTADNLEGHHLVIVRTLH